MLVLPGNQPLADQQKEERWYYLSQEAVGRLAWQLGGSSVWGAGMVSAESALCSLRPRVWNDGGGG